MTLGENFRSLDAHAQDGVAALQAHTPVDSGITANSWDYEIIDDGVDLQIIWSNYNVNKGVNIAIILQYGHGTGTGGYVAGRDYINPAIQPTFDKISDRVWKAVTSA
jgi:hypothetical protein